MLNEAEIIEQARQVLASLLVSIPFINNVKWKQDVKLHDYKRADFVTEVNVENGSFRLIGEVKRELQPRHVGDAIRQAKEYCTYVIDESVYPVVVSQYISPRSAEILASENVSYFDLLGNCRLCFANFYIEKQGRKSKSAEKRGVKSLFGLKSSRMLRLMLNDFVRPWQVKELSKKAELSLGQVSNIRRALLDQHYAIQLEEGGIYINQPSALLSEWSKIYKKNITNRASSYYSLLNPEERLDAIKEAMNEADKKKLGIIFSGLSAARWQAPFAKAMCESFYADIEGLEILKKHLKLEVVDVGPNVIIEELKDSFIFKEATECAPGIRCTNAIQTYLDLYTAGEREKEAAEHLESYLLKDRWNKSLRDVL